MSEEYMDCMEVVMQMGSYLDRELDADEIKKVEDHLARCGNCKNAFRWEDSILRLVKRCVGLDEMPDDLKKQILGSIRLEPDQNV